MKPSKSVESSPRKPGRHKKVVVEETVSDRERSRALLDAIRLQQINNIKPLTQHQRAYVYSSRIFLHRNYTVVSRTQ